MHYFLTTSGRYTTITMIRYLVPWLPESSLPVNATTAAPGPISSSTGSPTEMKRYLHSLGLPHLETLYNLPSPRATLLKTIWDQCWHGENQWVAGVMD